jgi:hypothetical protein
MKSGLQPHYLCVTSGLFSISLILYAFTNEKGFEKNVLAFVLFICFLFSQFFWYDPIKGSLIHRVDAIIAKITAVLFVIYTFLYKNLPSGVLFLYVLLGILSMVAIYRSDYFSTIEWCSDDHLVNHSLLHIAGFFASLYVFL